MKTKSSLLKWYDKEIRKDVVELTFEKDKFIQEIKNLKKEDIIPVKKQKITLWQRIKKVLMG
jgi:hypothetical protein